MNKWHKRFMEMTELVATWSSCVRRQVGAIIVRDKRIMTTGYNGAPAGVKTCVEKGECLRIKLGIPSGTHAETCFATHAEQNAIIQAGQDRCIGATMYIWGHNFICILCKRFIVQAGIKDVYLKKDEDSDIVHVSVEDIKRELEESAVCIN